MPEATHKTATILDRLASDAERLKAMMDNVDFCAEYLGFWQERASDELLLIHLAGQLGMDPVVLPGYKYLAVVRGVNITYKPMFWLRRADDGKDRVSAGTERKSHYRR
jgi:hypothetical protein